MSFIYEDLKYTSLVGDILNNEEFKKINNQVHHGKTRYDHSLKVSYSTYKISKALGLDYRAAARGGLLHDFFINNDKSLKGNIKSVFNHPFVAVENAKKTFAINEKEANIIESHMFFFNFKKLPKYLESWILITSDASIGTFEFVSSFKNQVVTYASVCTLFILNYIH